MDEEYLIELAEEMGLDDWIETMEEQKPTQDK